MSQFSLEAVLIQKSTDFSEVLKYNRNHGAGGKFSSGSAGSAGGASAGGGTHNPSGKQSATLKINGAGGKQSEEEIKVGDKLMLNHNQGGTTPQLSGVEVLGFEVTPYGTNAILRFNSGGVTKSSGHSLRRPAKAGTGVADAKAVKLANSAGNAKVTKVTQHKGSHSLIELDGTRTETNLSIDKLRQAGYGVDKAEEHNYSVKIRVSGRAK